MIRRLTGTYVIILTCLSLSTLGVSFELNGKQLLSIDQNVSASTWFRARNASGWSISGAFLTNEPSDDP